MQNNGLQIYWTFGRKNISCTSYKRSSASDYKLQSYSWNYADILWNGIRVDAVQAAFDKLSFKEQTLLEKRNAICMTCGRVGAWEERSTFEDLAVMFEGSTASGAERSYRRALNKLTKHLVDAGVLGVVELIQAAKHKGIHGVVYDYRAIHRFSNDDDKPGKIRINVRKNETDILEFADGDDWNTLVFAEVAIRQIRKLSMGELPKKLTIPFELEQEKLRHGS